MLVLTRKTQEQIQIGDNITITIIRVKGQAVRVGIEAPKDVRVMRAELTECAPPTEGKKDTGRPGQAAQTAAQPVSCPTSSMSDVDTPACQAPLSGHIALTRRLPGASTAPTIRRTQRLGPAVLRGGSRKF